MYEGRLGGEFSTQHFQAVKAKACAVGSGASGVMRVWNAAWVQCQEVRQHLEEMQKKKKKKGMDKNQIQSNIAVNPQEEDEGAEKTERRSEMGEDECSIIQQPTSLKEGVNMSDSEGIITTADSINHYLKSDLTGSGNGESQVLQSPVKKEKMTPRSPKNSNCYAKTKHHSEADLRSVDSAEDGTHFQSHQRLGRSLSEGSCVTSHFSVLSCFSPLNVRHKHCQSRTSPLEQNPQPLQNLPSSQNKSLQSGNLSWESKRDSNEMAGGGCMSSSQGHTDFRTPETLLTPTENNGDNVL